MEVRPTGATLAFFETGCRPRLGGDIFAYYSCENRTNFPAAHKKNCDTGRPLESNQLIKIKSTVI